MKIKFGDIVSGIEEDSEELVKIKKKSKVEKMTFQMYCSYFRHYRVECGRYKYM
jgi:hypothetical protein